MKLNEIETLDVSVPPQISQPLPKPTTAKSAAGSFQLQRFRLSDGPQAGVELLVVDSGRVRVAICPTRGMSLWKAHIDDMDFGWKSPVAGPIHPCFVAINEPSGIGWLDGFDELLVRCGLRSFGAPDFDEKDRVAFPLHGRIGNLPAQNVQLRLDADHSLLHVTGDVLEVRFLQYNLKLSVQYSLQFGEPRIDVSDRVTNAGGTPTSIQMLYHINIGAPILEAGAKLHIGAKKTYARNTRAAETLQDWQSYLPPTAGYAEQVYFSDSHACPDGWAKAMLATADESRGFAVHYQPATLPYFTQWKNTVSEADGYVTGLEPGTGFPNPRGFEESKGRTVELAAGESREFQLKLEGISTPDRVQQVKGELDALRGGQPVEALDSHNDWCMPA
jgi:galactose mutarotase-like enzyme